MTSPRDLWAAAGRCWLAAGVDDEALRAFEAAEAHASLAALYERRGRFQEAGLAYEKTQQWLDAARCFRLAGQMDEAERCLALGEIPIRRAWALVHEHGRVADALAVLERAPTRDAGETAGAMMVEARCDILRGDSDAAARKIGRALPLFPAISVASGFRIAIAWAVLISELLKRPDLAATVIASAPRGFQADVLWDEWSKRAFGSVISPPFPLHHENKEVGAK